MQTNKHSRPGRRKRQSQRTGSLVAFVLVLTVSLGTSALLHYKSNMLSQQPNSTVSVRSSNGQLANKGTASNGEVDAVTVGSREPVAQTPASPLQTSTAPGKHAAGKDLDLQGFIDEQIAAGKKKITIPPGRHRVTPQKKVHLSFTDVNDVEIIADGAEMICTETTRALAIKNCRNLTIRGLTIDYDPLPFTQGRIVAISADKKVHDIELFEGYPPADAVYNFKYAIFRPDTRTLRFGSYHRFTVEKTGPMRIRVTRTGHYQGEQVGDIIVIGTNQTPGGRIPHAVTIDDSVDVTLEGIKLYASNCFGFLENGCSKTTYRRCIIDRRSPEDDLKPRSDPRIRSLNADAYHSKKATIGPQIIECVALFQGDDCVNICGNYHMVMATKGNILRVIAKRGIDIKKGDSLEVVTYEGIRLPDAKVLEVQEKGTVNDEEREWLADQKKLHDSLKTRLKRIYMVRINRDVDLPRGSVIASANRMGNGFKVAGCIFGFNRSRGILIKASHGEVVDNRLESCVGQAIKVAPEWYWLESGSSKDLLIANNTIRNCSSDGIAIYAKAGKGGIAPAGAHEDIRIINNTMENVDGKHLYITSTIGLLLKDNVYDPDKIELINCEKVTRE